MLCSCGLRLGDGLQEGAGEALPKELPHSASSLRLPGRSQPDPAWLLPFTPSANLLVCLPSQAISDRCLWAQGHGGTLQRLQRHESLQSPSSGQPLPQPAGP